MSKYTKVFDLKTRVKATVELTDEEIKETIKRLIIDSKDESDKAKQHKANHLLRVAAFEGIDGLIEAVFTQSFRESFRDGVDFGFVNDEITVSPPQLVFKR